MLVMPMQSGRETHSVLVAEDDDDIRELVCELIQEHVGCEVHAAKNGREASARTKVKTRFRRRSVEYWLEP